ncbi:MAG: hypothetical protein LQ342_007171 [Letrouitia transgressa]|nr:MAG: hypothetical protein LQ342_007171 [Letrouitia transgressa]
MSNPDCSEGVRAHKAHDVQPMFCLEIHGSVRTSEAENNWKWVEALGQRFSPSSFTDTMWSHHQTADKTDDRTHPSTLHQGQKLRSACDRCHHAKLKCSGGKPCAGCYDSREQCCYSVSHKPGRPKGVKNKRNFDQTGTRKTKTARANLSASTKPPQHQQRQPSSSVPSMVPTQDDAMPDFNNTQLDGPLTTEMLQDMSASLTSSGYSELLDLETGDELRKHSMVKASVEEKI